MWRVHCEPARLHQEIARLNQLSIRLRWRPATALLLALLAACAAPHPVAPQYAAQVALAPPLARQIPHEIVAAGGTRSDPYHWLRDDTRTNPEILQYLAAENAYASAMLAPMQPLEDRLYREITARIKQDDASVPVLDRGYWYYSRFEAGSQYPVHARRKGSMDAPEEVLLDAQAMSSGHDFFQIGDYAVSPDNRLVAYAEDTVGRRQYRLRVRDIASGRTLADQVLNVEPDLVWAADSQTILYIAKDPVTLLGHIVRAHTVGGDAASDRTVYDEADPSYYLSIGESKSGEYLFIGMQSTLTSEWRYARADDATLAFEPVLPRQPGMEYQVQQHGRDFVMRTNWNAPNFRIMRAPIAGSGQLRNWQEVVTARADAFIEDYEVYRDMLVVNERSEGLLKLRVRSWDGRRDERIAADEPAYAAVLASLPEYDSRTLRYTYSSLTTPASVYDVDLDSGARSLRKRDPVLGDFDPARYQTEYLHIAARDGTPIPVSVVFRRGLPHDGRAPLLQYAYGSYGHSTDPTFNSTRLSLLDRGVVFAIAHVRGGQEMGRAWYEDGKLLHKKNSFTDFIDVSDGLVELGYAAPDKLFAMGGSAGGLLMGAIANMRPDRYAGIVAHVPFVDVVTTMLDESIPLTTNEFDEWGNPKQKVYYDYMLSYSPYDQVAPRPYPSMLVTTGLWDSQVQYYEPAKWVAKLRRNKTTNTPLIFVINMEAGHGGKSGRFEKYHEVARDYAFVLSGAGIHD